jgi:hypothetical protein
MKRFQQCNKIVKLWRYRWYLLIPFKWLWHSYCFPLPVTDDETLISVNLKGKMLWSILIGEAQIKMEWYHTHEEVLESLHKYRDGE